MSQSYQKHTQLFDICSMALPLLTVMYFFAADDVPDKNDTGTPMLNGHGVAPIKTPSAASHAKFPPLVIVLRVA